MRRRRINPTDDAVHYIINRKDKTGKLEVRYISSFKGRGLFATASFGKNDFVVEYRGELINCEESERRSKVYHPAVRVFMFDFLWHGKQWSIDAGIEDGSLGRLVNDNHISPNCKIKRIVVEGKLHLRIFAIKDISPGEEITYNYGNADWPWRNKMAEACTTPTEDVDLTICAQNTGQFSEQSDIPNTQINSSQIDIENGCEDLLLWLSSEPFSASGDVMVVDTSIPCTEDMELATCELITGQFSEQSDIPNTQAEDESAAEDREEEGGQLSNQEIAKKSVSIVSEGFASPSEQDPSVTSVSSVPVGCKAVKRKKLDDSAVKAVEKHLGKFIQACALPGKVDCEGSLRAESHALKERDWLALKFYVKNRITTLKRRL
ncbi:hypothetical protein GJAV_G00212730 [Gymnothorax javanicus]|nr:hypothetical protein GJAV_G00212730 [Gymnothorax javanicus]